ncbi:hypothetical protein A4R26_12330 [Niastella populi]|uniref:Uncharacterized protein n=1 Tax=Niastella populi TaxID=550983 RepID=A0A1V9GAL5_9BACT|nr:hypothetical protein A4R26_12330 [Niastella populi]
MVNGLAKRETANVKGLANFRLTYELAPPEIYCYLPKKFAVSHFAIIVSRAKPFKVKTKKGYFFTFAVSRLPT